MSRGHIINCAPTILNTFLFVLVFIIGHTALKCMCDTVTVSQRMSNMHLQLVSLVKFQTPFISVIAMLVT